MKVGPRTVGAYAIAHVELLVQLAIGEAGAAHLDVLEQRQVAHLVLHERLVELVGLLVVVGLDATNVMRRAARQRLDQLGDRVLDLEAGRGGALLGAGLLGEQAANEAALRRLSEDDQIIVEQIAILVEEAVGIVDDLEILLECVSERGSEQTEPALSLSLSLVHRLHNA